MSLGLLAVSVALNFRMAYRSADSDLDGKLYGAGAAFGDCLKAVAPFMASWGARHGDVLAALSAVALFGICTGYSFTAALGFAAEHRATKEAAALGGMESYADLRSEKKRLEDRLTFLGLQRSSAEVESAVAALLRQRVWTGGQTVGGLSEDCGIDRKSTRTVCEAVAKLKVELARAQQVEDFTADYQAVLRKLASTDAGSSVSSADAQVDALVRMAGALTVGMSKDEVALWLSLLLASFIEVGSGAGLFMVTTPWRVKPVGKLEGHKRGKPQRLGHVDAYMLERIEPGEGVLAEAELFEDYVRWCRKGKAVAYAEAEFACRFAELGAGAGLAATSRGRRLFYRGVQLIRESDV